MDEYGNIMIYINGTYTTIFKSTYTSKTKSEKKLSAGIHTRTQTLKLVPGEDYLDLRSMSLKV